MGEMVNRKAARKNLRDFVDLLEGKGIEPRLAFGTLLGAYRERDIIQWDTDIDLAIEDEQLGRLKHIARVGGPLEKAGFVPYRTWTGLVSYIRDQVYVDVYVFSKRENGYVCKILTPTGENTGLFKMTEKEWLRPRRIPMLGKRLLAPRNTQAYLARVYGDDFMIPKRNAHANHFADNDEG